MFFGRYWHFSAYFSHWVYFGLSSNPLKSAQVAKSVNLLFTVLKVPSLNLAFEFFLFPSYSDSITSDQTIRGMFCGGRKPVLSSIGAGKHSVKPQI